LPSRAGFLRRLFRHEGVSARQEELPRTNAVRGSNDALQSKLERVRLEVFPTKDAERLVDQIPPESLVAITCSPTRGVRATIDLTRRLNGLGHQLIPHLAARLVNDKVELQEILDELGALDIKRLFLIGGDPPEPAGRFSSSLEILQAMTELDHGITEVGIGAYPEGHPLVDDQTLFDALDEKQHFAAYMVTQLCFDPQAIIQWLTDMRARGIRLPVWIGVPGVGERAKLLKTALKIGVGESARFLQSHRELVGKMVKPGGYSPDELLLALAPSLQDPELDIHGFHFYTFNQVASTEDWRVCMLARLRNE
jgi:methylenetetrahydrofolate reductase (NADPH)